MTPRRALGLQVVVVVLLLVGLVPVAGLVITSALQQRDQAKARAEAEAARLGRLAALREADLVDGGRDVLAAIAKTTLLSPTDGAACATRLEALLPLYPRFTNLGMVGPAGELLCAAVRPAQPTNFADRAWFQRAISTGRFAVGDYQRGRITGRPSLVFGLPVADADGAVRAVAWAALDLGWLQQFGRNLQLASDRALAVLDRTGTVLARQPDSQRWVGRKLPGFDGRALRRGPYTVEAEGLDGIRRLYAVTPLGEAPDPHAAVAVGIPTAAAYADAEDTLRRNLVYLTVLALLGLVVARFAAHRLIVRPTRALVAVSGRLAAGELGARLAHPYPPGELGDLSRAFDDMADALESRDAALSQAVLDRRRTMAQLQAVIDNAPMSIYMKDNEGRYLLVNRRFEEQSGASRGDLIGRRPADVFTGGPWVLGHRNDMAVFATGEASQDHEPIRLGDSLLTFLTFRFPLADAAGRPYAMCRIATDITEHIEGQAQRERLEAQLSQAQRLESLGQLAGGVAHDFNNLLAVILNYADFILDALPEEEAPVTEGESIRSDVLAIRRAGEAAAALTRQLLIFGRRDRVQPRLIHLDALLEGMEPFLRRTLGEDIVFEVRAAPGSPAVCADPGRLEQVIMNLVVNARDAMDSGGTLLITVEEVDVPPDQDDLSTLAPGPHVHLAVADTGSGMPPEVAGRAFEPFFTTKPKGHGTGLGLATAFGVVSEAGGAISLNSTPGLGTTVHVYLPAAAAGPPDDRSEESSGAAGPSSATVLVVEDEDEVRVVTERILASHGYAVLTAADGAEALRTCHTYQGPIDLVVSDVVMPGLSGPDFVERARTVRPEMRAIFMSGYPEDFLARRHSVDLEVEVIGKPFTAEVLLHSVRAALEPD